MAEENLVADRLTVAVAFDDLFELQAAATAQGDKDLENLAEEIMHGACTKLATDPPPPPSHDSAKTFATAALFCCKAWLEAEAAGGEIGPVLILRALEAAAA